MSDDLLPDELERLRFEVFGDKVSRDELMQGGVKVGSRSELKACEFEWGGTDLRTLYVSHEVYTELRFIAERLDYVDLLRLLHRCRMKYS